jgi:hypothetical protein
MNVFYYNEITDISGHSRGRFLADEGKITNTIMCRNHSTVKKHEPWCRLYHRPPIWIIIHHMSPAYIAQNYTSYRNLPTNF